MDWSEGSDRKYAIHSESKPTFGIYGGTFLKSRMNSWNNSLSPLASFSMPNLWFDEMGLYNIGLVKTGIIVPV